MAGGAISSADMESLPAELREELEQAKEKMESFMTSMVEKVDAAVQVHAKRLEELQSQLESVKASEGSVGARAAAVGRMIEAESRALAERREELERLRGESSAVPKETEGLEKEAVAVRTELEGHRAELQKWERSTAYQMGELERGVEYYKRLGLRFERAEGGRVKLVFNAVDASDPAREFSITIHVSPEETYSTSDCSPPIPHLRALEAKLNEDGNFSNFVQQLRAAFKSLCKE